MAHVRIFHQREKLFKLVYDEDEFDGLIRGEDRMHVEWRCRLYADYFKRHL